MDNISEELKLPIPLIVLSQLHRGVDTDNDLTFKMFVFPLKYKTDDVGWVVMIKVFDIELVNCGVIHNGNTHIACYHSGFFDYLVNCEFDLRRIDFVLRLIVGAEY